MIIKKITSLFINNAFQSSRIAVAVSGGADSIALLYMLHTLSAELSLELSVVHVNYNLRGKESMCETEYVQHCCRELSIPCYVKNVEGLSLSDSGLENSARNIRYEFFEKLRNEENIDYIALAHNKNDQAETLLFRLIRGTGLKGAGAMVPLRDGIYLRPLLDCSRSEIEEWLRAEGIKWHNDSSNSDNYYSRNTLRNNVMPLLSSINSSAMDNMFLFTKHMQRLQSAVDIAFYDWFSKVMLFESDKSLVLNTSVESPFLFDFIPTLLQRRGVTVTQRHVETLLRFWTIAGKELLLSKGYHAITLGDKLILKKRRSDEFSFEKKAVVFVDGVCIVSPLFVIDKQFVPNGAHWVRPVKKDDVITHNGRKQNILKILKDKKVPVWLRERYPVFLDSHNSLLPLF